MDINEIERLRDGFNIILVCKEIIEKIKDFSDDLPLEVGRSIIKEDFQEVLRLAFEYEATHEKLADEIWDSINNVRDSYNLNETL